MSPLAQAIGTAFLVVIFTTVWRVEFKKWAKEFWQALTTDREIRKMLVALALLLWVIALVALNDGAIRAALRGVQ